MDLANWRISWQKLVSRLWIPTLVVVVAIAVWRVFLVVPDWLEEKVTRSLRKEEIVVTSFPVERIGFNQTRIGEGSLLYKDSSLRWETIHVNYQIDELIRGQVGHVDIQNPVVLFSWELPMTEASQLSMGQPVVAGIPEDDWIEPEIVLLDKVDEADIDVSTVEAVAVDAIPVALEKISPWEILQDLPLDSFAISEGVFDLQLQDVTQFSAAFEGQLERQPFGVSGEWLLDSPEISMHVSLRAPTDEPVVTLQGESAMPVGAVRDLGNRYVNLLENCEAFPTITYSGQLVLDILAEKHANQPVYGSAEASMDELALMVPGTDLEVGLIELVVAGFYKNDKVNLEGGAEVLIPIEENMSVEPFGLRFSLKDTNRFSVETEVIEWKSKGLESRCAVMGTGDLSTYPQMGWARLETSFSQLAYKSIHLEPFSILLSPGMDQIPFEASPVGLNQFGTIWLEELRGEFAPTMDNGRGQFKLYGLLGEELGTGGLMFLHNQRFSQYIFSFLENHETEGIQGSIREEGRKLNLDLSGQLLTPWINTLARWFGYSSYTLGGNSPEIDAELNWFSPILTGTAELILDGMDLSIGNGTRMEGISGSIDLAVMVMPRTRGRQITRIDKLTNGSIEMHDIEIEWELKHIRELRVTRFSGKIGEGFVELEPFSVDPLNPVVETAILIRKFDADLLRQWLKEDRFSIEGYISGQIPVGWKDGEVVVGSGAFDLDTHMENGRLKFEDEQFLRETFASFGGIPVDLKDRLLNALWENGIQMNKMEIYLGPTPNEEELLFRIAANGETSNDLLEFPIGGLVINQLISLNDLAILMNMVAPIRIDPELGNQ